MFRFLGFVVIDDIRDWIGKIGTADSRSNLPWEEIGETNGWLVGDPTCYVGEPGT